jgi:hypothetical protein
MGEHNRVVRLGVIGGAIAAYHDNEGSDMSGRGRTVLARETGSSARSAAVHAEAVLVVVATPGQAPAPCSATSGSRRACGLVPDSSGICTVCPYHHVHFLSWRPKSATIAHPWIPANPKEGRGWDTSNDSSLASECIAGSPANPPYNRGDKRPQGAHLGMPRSIAMHNSRKEGME